jgi:hypothetical protein
MAFLIGGSSAALFASIDLMLVRRYRLTLGSVPWWSMRLLIDGVQGMAAIVVVEIAAIKVEGLSDPIVWVLAGIFATRLIQGLQYGGSGQRITFDVKALVDRLTVPLDERIDSASAAGKSASDRSLANALLKNDVTPTKLADELIIAMQARRALSPKVTEVEYLKKVAGGEQPVEKRMRVLVAYAREIQLLGTVRRLKRS